MIINPAAEPPCDPSFFSMHRALFILFFQWICSGLTLSARDFSSVELRAAARQIWQNECGGTVEGLVSWNAGEDFASVGIGHFIWYAEGRRGPFAESFPDLVRLMQREGLQVPSWLKGPCPWSSRQEFLAQQKGAQVRQLRDLLQREQSIQARFLWLRMQGALPKLLAQARDPKALRARFEGLAESAAGAFCLMDYVNFKGEGLAAGERYQGQGWGLLQVLEAMQESSPAEFARAAEAVLRRRVALAPAARGEKRWLQGWVNRCRRYAAQVNS